MAAAAVVLVWFIITVVGPALKVFADVFRSHDLGGFAKAMWLLFIIFLPVLGVVVYLIARGHKMQEHSVHQAQQQEAATRQYIQNVTASGGSADEIARLADLREKGVISDAEFQQAKAKALA